MKFTILQINFAKALNQVSRVVGTRTTLPVLSNILISAEKGKIVLSATDLEVAIVVKTTGKVEEEGQLTVPARLLSDFVLNNNDESINLLTKKNIINLKSARFEANINGISAEEFPTVPEMTKEWSSSLSRDDFLDALKKVAIAPAHDETRPVLAGIYFQFEGKKLTIAATDSYRLAEKKLQLEKEVVDNKFIVPARTMTEVFRLLSGSDDKEIIISSAENQVAFKIGETLVISRLIEGAFPNYSQIIPEKSNIIVKVNYAEILSALKMTALFAKDAANNIKIETMPKEGKLIVKTIASEIGDATSEVKAEITGQKIEIAFNVKYVLDFLQVITDETIIFGFNDNASAGVIKTEKDAGFVYIVMPLKIEK